MRAPGCLMRGKPVRILCAVEGLLYMAPACCMWLLLGVAVVEWPRMAAENALGLIAAKPGLYLMAAAMGFGVNSLAYIVIQLASSLTLKARRARPSGLCCERWTFCCADTQSWHQ